MKNIFQIFSSDLEMAACRVAQYVENHSTYTPLISRDGDRFIVKIAKSKVSMNDVRAMAGVALGIEWQMRHDTDLVTPLTAYEWV